MNWIKMRGFQKERKDLKMNEEKALTRNTVCENKTNTKRVLQRANRHVQMWTISRVTLSWQNTVCQGAGRKSKIL